MDEGLSNFKKEAGKPSFEYKGELKNIYGPFIRKSLAFLSIVLIGMGVFWYKTCSTPEGCPGKYMVPEGHCLEDVYRDLSEKHGPQGYFVYGLGECNGIKDLENKPLYAGEVLYYSLAFDGPMK